jgi:hypothetical protein
MDEESELRRFFHDAGCKVAGVNLVMDPKRSDRSRGFGFVDFEDARSLDLALQFHHKEAEGLAGKNQKLRIERVHAAMDEPRKREQTMLEERNRTEEMERELVLRLNEFVQEVTQKFDWQKVLQAHGLPLQDEKRKQAMLRQAMETTSEFVQKIYTAIEVDKEHATDKRAMPRGAHGEQRPGMRTQSSVCEDSFAALAVSSSRGDLDPPAITTNPSQHKGGAAQGSCTIAVSPFAAFQLSHQKPACKASSDAQPDAAEATASAERGVGTEDYLPSPAGHMEIRVRNTFLEFGVPEARPLRRTRSAHQVVGSEVADSALESRSYFIRM